MVKFCVAEFWVFGRRPCLVSSTLTVKVKLPAIEAFPEITPVVAFSLRPGGRLPAVTFHL